MLEERASMNVDVSLKGFKQIDRTLGQLPKATGKRILRKIGIEALKPIAADMRARAPLDEGDLKEGITVGTKLTRSQRRFQGFNAGGKDPHIVVVHAGPGAHPQAILQEIGTVHHAANPFVAPAWEAGKHGALKYVATELGDVVKKAAARAAKKGKLRAS